MNTCEICCKPIPYKDVLRLGDHWYCLSCLSKAVSEDSHVRIDEPEQPLPAHIEHAIELGMTTREQWEKSLNEPTDKNRFKRHG